MTNSGTSKKMQFDTVIDQQVDNNRYIYLTGDINEDKAKEVIERMLELQEIDPLEEITMIINSYGGEVYSMFAITDMMEIIIHL